MPGPLVVAALLVDDLVRPTRLLAARRTAPPTLAGKWELPGGKVEPGEPLAVALRRELREELEVEVVIGSELVPPVGATWPLPAGLRMRTWWCAASAGQPRLTGVHDELRWVTAATVTDLDWLPGDLPLLPHLVAALSA